MPYSSEVLLEALDLLEEQESKLLVWGDTSGFFNQQEVLDLLTPTLACKADPTDLFYQLLDYGYLFPVETMLGVEGYRTRMAEAVNLYRNQRQWFRGQKLKNTRSLVADYRFLRRRRRYPKRELEAEALLQCWQPLLQKRPLRQEAITALLKGYTLANFQAQSTDRILRAWERHSQPMRTPSGTIVCAGTGSGKTLSFYLPALTALAADIVAERTERVRILAIYPRKELLKDQFNETWQQCRKLDPLLTQAAGRKICIGALFGDTPEDQKAVAAKNQAGNYHFSLLQCPSKGCDGQMVWRQDKQQRQQQQLQCVKCGVHTGDDEISITRRAILEQVPDILFTTTEMLNQHLGNRRYQKLFGIGKDNPGPKLVLLDEVHTYTGNTGAQTAYLLRRWMQRAFCRPHFVGLSATLADAENLFAELVGAQTKHVRLIEPNNDEMTEEGAEYLMVLRGDPVSQTSLLSTTIQTSMLTRRILDNRNKISKGVWGNKTFVFTDNLDVVNRLYHDLADAEGWNSNFSLTPKDSSLAALRRTDGSATAKLQHARYGQDWSMPLAIGHTLADEDRAIVERTSSQDAGVSREAEIVVATASLEVGFNDPDVGAVIQHKAPRDVASYLQRKGRAGRSRTMRPWMLAVMSDFGRDRMAFQQYENLIDPEVKRQGLPLGNSHIQKMQAAMATLDWLGLHNQAKSLWNLLNWPQDGGQGNDKQRQLQQLLEQVSTVLTDSQQQQKLSAYLGGALGLDEHSLQRVLWHPPRAIMLEFLPTLKRQLQSNWSEFGEPWKGVSKERSPVPEFIPSALFDELNQATLNIELRRGRDGAFSDWQALNFFQGMREFAPGRISKRYAVKSRYDADWLVPSDFEPAANICQQLPFEISEAFGNGVIHAEGEVRCPEQGVMKVYRPTAVATQQLRYDAGLTEKSNSQLHWQVTFHCDSPAQRFSPPKGPWSSQLEEIQFFTHQQLAPLEITRYCTGSTASMRFRDGAQGHARFHWTHNDQAVVIGNKQWFDGLCLRFNINEQQLLALVDSPALAKALRSQFFAAQVKALSAFEFDPFSANWISETYLAAIALALMSESSIDKVLDDLTGPQAGQRLIAVSDSLFQSGLELDGEEAEPERLQAQMRDMFSQPSLLMELAQCAEYLRRPLTDSGAYLPWLKTLLSNSIAAVAQKWQLTTLPDVDERALIIDTQWHGGQLQLWISEAEPGGSGIVSRIADRYRVDPVQVLNMWVRSMTAGDYEQLDEDLFQLLQTLPQQAPLTETLKSIRTATNYQQRAAANKNLQHLLRESGFVVSHSFMAVLHSRLLRPGSNERHDNNLTEWLLLWRELEDKANLELNLNAVCHAIAKQAYGTNSSQVFNEYCRLQGQLWPRGNVIRQAELNHYNPFTKPGQGTERLLLANLFSEQLPSVNVADPEWLPTLHQLIGSHGSAEVKVPRALIHQFNEMITTVNVKPINYYGLVLYPRLAGIRRDRSDLMACFELAEALQ
ncbi:protein DpdJ [Ferrimonas senticii]|uniref:protein DpdJ n=1 Tax=Ferrimonas senticii TaxID=394566 RepID=UPI0004274F4D|nr:protein DpdJ [Ferrimonas senticii]